MKKIVIWGSTGSLGRQVLEVLENYTRDFQIVAISGKTNAGLLNEQAQKYHVKRAFIGENTLPPNADIVVNLLSGTAGIRPTKTALKSGKALLLANKESLVAEGEEIMRLCKTPIIPIDSEHNAIYEILRQNPGKEIEKIILPCSGGPFHGLKDLSPVTVEQALHHPRWQMGPKITIESATLINKGLEIIEAFYLFNLPLNKIEVKIHPECQIHGMVKFINEAQPIAYLAPPDMKEHLENALLRSIDKAPKRTIRPLLPNEFQLGEPNHSLLPGIKIVLNYFQKNPHKMKEFLQNEELQIQKFLNKEVDFLTLLSSLELFGQNS